MPDFDAGTYNPAGGSPAADLSITFGGTTAAAILGGPMSDFFAPTYIPNGGHPPGGPTLPAGLGGGGRQEVYIDRAPYPPDDPTKPAVNYPAGGGPEQQWDVASQSWT